jgi:NADH-quinone oxidoreductase subunit C
MFGIIFSQHPQLGRILTDYSFLGHPLRRDYPLSGFTAVYYDSVEGRVMNEPVSLAQELRLNKNAADARRFFDFDDML